MGGTWKVLDGLRLACCLDAGAKLIAAIWVIIAVWFADNWLTAAAMSAFMVLGAVFNVLTAVVAAAAVGGTVMIVSTVSSSVSSLVASNALYIVLFVYPVCPVVVRSSIAIRRRP
jgi:hypothetical protein